MKGRPKIDIISRIFSVNSADEALVIVRDNAGLPSAFTMLGKIEIATIAIKEQIETIDEINAFLFFFNPLNNPMLSIEMKAITGTINSRGSV